MNAQANIDYEEIKNNTSDITVKCWTSDKKLHNEDGPAKISYFADGTVSTEAWYTHGVQSRLGGPAYLSYNIDGSLFLEEWLLDGVPHRTDGPAIVEYNEDGTIRYAAYYENGELVSEPIYNS